ncbi:uncharacterized protein ACRADG_000701 [Cochliomyia hominivorax]
MVLVRSVIRNVKTSKGDASYSTYDMLEEIRSRPSIWKISSVAHMDRTEFANSWRSVLEALIPRFRELNENEQIKITVDMRKYYSRLKNELILTIKYKQEGDKRYRLFNYARNMDYVLKDRGIKLEEVFNQDELNAMELFEKRYKECYATKALNKNNNKTEILQQNNDSPNGNNEASDEIMEMEDAEMYSQYSYDPAMHYQETANPYHRDTHKSGEIRKAKDADQAFFDSLKPWLRKMNPTQKLDFKIQFLEILKKHQI